MQRVLVVDDDRLVADTLALIFEKNGFAAKAAYRADEALRCARDYTPDLMLCDITMPGRDGLSLVLDVSRELPSCRIEPIPRLSCLNRRTSGADRNRR